uniref:Immunoglobulin C1-set domain-containing protein n=1 Tax=Oreochromis niloticus TaxID=8128 RepID=A0A669EKQ1_ORENI
GPWGWGKVNNQNVLLFCFVCFFFWSEIKLEQSPSEVKRPGERVKLSCIISGYDLTCTGYDRGLAEL